MKDRHNKIDFMSMSEENALALSIQLSEAEKNNLKKEEEKKDMGQYLKGLFMKDALRSLKQKAKAKQLLEEEMKVTPNLCKLKLNREKIKQHFLLDAQSFHLRCGTYQ